MLLNERGHEGVDMLVLTRLVLFVRCKFIANDVRMAILEMVFMWLCIFDESLTNLNSRVIRRLFSFVTNPLEPISKQIRSQENPWAWMSCLRARISQIFSHGQNYKTTIVAILIVLQY